MKKFGILLIVLVVLVGVGYTFGRNLKSKGQDQPSQTESLPNSPTDATPENTIRSSIKNLLAQNKPMKCTIKVDANDKDGRGKMTGVTYVANNKMRSDIEMEEKNGNRTLQIHTISDGDWVYTWSDAQPNSAMKMKISQLENEFEQSPTRGWQDLEKEYDYNCSTWFPVDNSKFIPPSDIEFRDLTEMMTGFQNTMGDKDICAICDSAPDEETKKQCRQSANRTSSSNRYSVSPANPGA